MKSPDQQRTERRVEILRSAVHAMNGPLGVIVMNAELATEYIRRDKPDEARRVLDKLKGSAELCSRMLSDGLKIATDDLVEPAPSLSCAEFVQTLPSADRAELAIRVEGEVPDVQVPAFLQRAMAPLLDNAVEHGASELSLAFQRRANGLQIDVEDNGRGVAKPMEKVMFEPFVTSRSDSHPGLGLYRARRLMEAAGGSIVLAAGRGGGASFRLLLPLSQDGARSTPAAAPPGASLAADGAQARPTGVPGILLIEDQSNLRRTLHDALLCCGYHVIGPAATLDEALTLTAQHRPDAALVDYRLGGCTADALMERLAAENIPFAILTGEDRRGLPERWQAHLVISKPCGLQALKRGVESLLDNPVPGVER